MEDNDVITVQLIIQCKSCLVKHKADIHTGIEERHMQSHCYSIVLPVNVT